MKRPKKNERVDALKRLLKELGIYNAFIRDRKEQHPSMSGFWIDDYFPDIIDRTFVWSRTNNPELWTFLNINSRCMFPIAILNDKAVFNALKERCSNFLKKYGQKRKST